MRAGRRCLQARGVHRRRFGFRFQASVRPGDASNHRIGDLQNFAAGAKLLQRGVVGQFFVPAQALPQRGTHTQKLQHAPVGGLEIGPQNQAGHELALSEIVAAAGRAVIGQMFAAQLQGHLRHLFNHRCLALVCLHATQDAATL